MPRRPLDGARRVTGDTATHARYGVSNATDYGADTGEIIRAMFKGAIARWWSTTGGNSVSVTSTRWRVTIQHLSAYAGGTGTEAEGAAIGYVGSTGSSTTGPHVHGFVIDRWTGKRYSIEEWLVKFFGFKNSAPAGGTVPGPYSYSLAGGGTTPIVPKPKAEEDMQPTNYVNKATMPGGKFAAGSQCITLWPSGAVQHYELTNQPRNEQIAYIMYDLFGAHKSLEKQVFDSIVAAHAALQGATTGGDGTYNGDGFASVIAAIEELPTAIENGNAARAAIVKE